MPDSPDDVSEAPPTPLNSMTAPDIRALIAQAQAAARAEATREAGSVDDYAEALAFRRLLVEAAREYPDLGK